MASKSKSKKGKTEKGLNKTQLLGEIAAKAGLTRAQVADVFGALSAVVGAELGAGRPITVPGLVKLKVQKKAATAARPGINPFTKEPITIKAKPARRQVKVRPIKALKDMV